MYGTVGQDAGILEGMDRRPAPLNDWIHDVLRESVRRVIPHDQQYTLLFDKLEILIALSAARHHDIKYPDPDPYFVTGAFGYRVGNAKTVLGDIRRSIEKGKTASPYVTAGIIGDSVEDCKRWLDALEKWVPTLRRSRWW